MSIVAEQLDEEIIFPSDAELNKLTKEDLKTLIRRVEARDKKEERQKEWGKQFDIWLIRAARKERPVEFQLSSPLYLISGENESSVTVVGVPKRVDKYEIQILVSGEEIWISKPNILACKSVIVPT